MKAADAPEALQRILAEFGDRGIRLYDAGMRRPTLDDVFLRLTGHVAEEEAAGTQRQRPSRAAGGPATSARRRREKKAERRAS